MGRGQVFLDPSKFLNIYRALESFSFPHLFVHLGKTSEFIGSISSHDLQSVLFRPSELISPLLIQIPPQFIERRSEVENESSMGVRGYARLRRKVRKSGLE